jgi:dTDP-4-amino-4,6-dideoxygalactose transaminase
VPVHLTSAFGRLGSADGVFPVAERTASELLTLPLFAEITVEQQEQVTCALAAALLRS